MKIENIFSDLWLAAFWGPLAVGVIIFALGKIFSGKKEEKTVTLKYIQEVVIKHVVEIKENNKASLPKPEAEKGGTNDDPTPALVLVALLFLSFFYAKYQVEVIAVISGISTFILSFVLFTAFFGINNNIRHDQKWSRYLLTTSFLALLGYPMMYIAINPIYAPIEVSNMSNYIAKDGIVGMFETFGLNGVTFIALQALGFITLALAMLIQALSLTFYTSAIKLAVTEEPGSITRAIVQLTSKFSQPYKTIAISTFFYAISFMLISGLGYEWWYSTANNSIQPTVFGGG